MVHESGASGVAANTTMGDGTVRQRERMQTRDHGTAKTSRTDVTNDLLRHAGDGQPPTPLPEGTGGQWSRPTIHATFWQVIKIINAVCGCLSLLDAHIDEKDVRTRYRHFLVTEAKSMLGKPSDVAFIVLSRR